MGRPLPRSVWAALGVVGALVGASATLSRVTSGPLPSDAPMAALALGGLTVGTLSLVRAMRGPSSARF